MHHSVVQVGQASTHCVCIFFCMPSSMLFRCLVPAEATGLVVGEGGVTGQFSDACIRVSDEGDTPGLSDRIISISGDQKNGEAACQMIIQRLYEAQEVAPGDQGIFVLLVPDTFPESEDVLQKVREVSGAEIHLEPDTIPGTDDCALQIVGGYNETLAAVFQLGALMAFDPLESSDHGTDEVHTQPQPPLVAYFQDAVGLETQMEMEESDVSKAETEKIEHPGVELEHEGAEPEQQEQPEQPEEQPEAQPEPPEPLESTELVVEKTFEATSEHGEDVVLDPEEASKELDATDEILSQAEPFEEREEAGETDALEEAAAVNVDHPSGMPMSVCFAVPASVAAWVVGRKGQSIINLRNRSRARIDVSNDVSAYRMIEIQADQDAVMLGIELLLEQISLLPDGSPEFVRIVLPPNSAGYIIGRGGESIKELRRMSGAEIDLDQESVSMSESKLVKIRGSVQEMIHASQLVTQRVAEVANGKPFGKPRSDIDQLQALLTESNHLQASLTMLIPADAVNRLPKARLSQVERLTGSQIEVDGLGGRTSGVQQLQIVGTRNGNAMAILYLQEIFAEHLRSGQTPTGNGQGRDKMVRSKSAGRSRTNGTGPGPNGSSQKRPSSRGPQRANLAKGTARGAQSRRQ